MARLRQQGHEHGASKNEIVLAIHEVAGSTHDTREKYLRELKQRRFISNGAGQGFNLNHESAESDDDTSILAELSGRINNLEIDLAELMRESIYWVPRTKAERRTQHDRKQQQQTNN